MKKECTDVLKEIHSLIHGDHVQSDIISFQSDNSDSEVIIQVIKIRKVDVDIIYSHIKKETENILLQVYGASDQTVKQ